MSNFICPFCNNGVSDHFSTHSSHFICFEGNKPSGVVEQKEGFMLEFRKCPHCEKTNVVAIGINGDFDNHIVHLYPTSHAQQFPEYVPSAIRSDYEEACAIVKLSPKASATLARRCLQGIIRDFWGITDRKNLYEEIDAIKEKVPASQWKAIDSLRKIGNIGAHMEKNVNVIINIEPDEAEKLIKLIELLIKQWYIARYDQEQLYVEIVANDNMIQKSKQSES